MNLVTPKVGAKHELFFNKPASGALNKSFCLAPALDFIKFIIVRNSIIVTLCFAT
jgi:hypothetical protein